MSDISLLKGIENNGLDKYRLGEPEENKEINVQGKEELFELAIELPKLYRKNNHEVISALIRNYIQRYPKCIDGYICFSTFYMKIKNYRDCLNLIYAALYVDKENKSLINLLKECEEKLVLEICQIPGKYKNWIGYPESRIANDKRDVYDYNDNNYANCDNINKINKKEEEEEKNMKNMKNMKKKKKEINAYTNKSMYNFKKMQIMRHGQYYVALAKKDLIPGEIIFQSKPFMLTQHIFCEEYTYSTCYHCLKERKIKEKYYACPINPHTCPYIFCSWQCLSNNIKIHQVECSILPIISAASKECNLSYYIVLHIFRVLIKSKINKGYKDKEHNIINDIFSLQSYYYSVKENQKELFESFNILSNRIILEFPSSFYLHLKQKELVEFMLIIWQHSPFIKYYSPSSIIQHTNPEIAFAVFFCPLISKLHHSCVPTCTVHFDEYGILSVRSLCNIPEGGKLCVSILYDQYLPLKIRKNVRGMPRVFACGCVRCTDPTENNLHLRSMKCPRCIIGYIYPIKTEALIEALKLYRFDKQADVLSKKRGISEYKMVSDKIHDKERDQTGEEINYNGKMNSHNNNNNNNINHNTHHTNDHHNNTHHTSDHHNNTHHNNNKNNGKLFNDNEMNVLKKLGNEMERWICSTCGKLSFAGNKKCIKLENKVFLHYNEAEKNYMDGNLILARKELLHIYNEYCYILNPNHYILFNVNVLLAGLLRYDPNKDLFNSLLHLRKAIISADNVLPICSLEKIHLHTCLSEYTYMCSNLYKLYHKGMGISPEYIIDPLFSAIWNSCVITGYESTLTIILLQQLRNFCILLNKFTSPYNKIIFHINRKEEFCDFYYQVTQKKNHPLKHIKKIIEHDPFYPIYMSCQYFHIKDTNKYFINILKSFKNIRYIGNGLTAISLAAAVGNVELVKILLKLNYSLFTKNELNMNVLLYMASSLLPDEQIVYHSNYYYTLMKEIKLQHVNFEEFQNEYRKYINVISNTVEPTELIKGNKINHYQINNRYNNKYDTTHIDSQCMHSYELKNTFPFNDIPLDDDFIYGEKSKELDKKQATILILFLTYLDKLQIKRKKNYKIKYNKKWTLSKRIQSFQKKKKKKKKKKKLKI
ncbi:hypothetical protein PFFCH_04453 [Plasmodium falciparum FCH/4]|uniref:Uncharacterized protein n=1 Tax=Plasmodium falciparum FCH/4 TaxID=1036724 RepID=A0A024VHW3_PLAFA|nr:hypothetical protein PFFCH_04453 [Plasmodium falciparum FCH/4]